MSQYRHHVFVCTAGLWCPRDGDAEDIVRQLKQAVAAAGLTGQVRINKAGCFSQCGHGPMVVVYPEGCWYAGVSPADANEIVRSHLVGGTPVARLRYHAPAGDNKDLNHYPLEWVAAELAKK